MLQNSSLSTCKVRTSRRTFVAGVGALLALPAVRAQPRAAVGKVAIATVGSASFEFLPLILAQKLGFFESEAVAVEVIDFADEGRAVGAAAAGLVQVVCGSYTQALRLNAQDKAFSAFVMQGRAPQVALGISTRNLPDARWALQLKGLRVGVVELGSTSHLVASRVLAKAGMLRGEMSFIDVGSSAGALAALRAGQIDALCNVDPLMTVLEQKGEVKIVADTRTLKGSLEVFGGPMPEACLFAPRDYLKRQAASVQAVSNALVRSLKWLRTAGPGDIVKTVPEAYLLGDRALYLAAFSKMREAFSLDGLMPEDGARTALKALAEFDDSVKAARVNLGLTYTNDFVIRSKRQLFV